MHQPQSAKGKGVMAMKELLEYAQNKLDEACRGGTVVDINYWSGYCDGIRACIRETE